MAVNEHLSSYSTTAASNTPAGSDAVGTDLDNHLRDIKRNVRFASNWPVQAAKITAYTATVSDHASLILVDCSATAVTVTLPAAATAGDGFKIGFKRSAGATGGNALTVDGSGAETIDGTASVALSQLNEAVWLACDGTSWQVASRGNTLDTTSALTVRGDMLYRDASGDQRLAVGSASQFVTSDGTDPAWSSGPWAYVASVTLSADALIEFFHDGIDNAGADLAADYDYHLVWNNVQPSISGTTYLMELFEAGAYRTGSSQYLQQAQGTLGGASATRFGGFWDTWFPEGGQNTDTTYTTIQPGVFGVSTIRNAASTTFSTHLYTYAYTGGTLGVLTNWSHGVTANGNLTRAATKFKIYTAAGTLNTGVIDYYRSKRT